MSNKNILHLILGCKEPRYSLIEDAAKKTWMTKTPDNIKSIFMYGGASSIFWDEGDSFYVNRPENHYYNICLYKTITAFEWFMESDFDYIYRTNSTGYFDLQLVVNFLKDKPLKEFYCGWKGKLDEIEFASGSGFFLSKDIVEKIVSNREILYDYNLPGWNDDVSIGKFISNELNVGIFSEYTRLDLLPEDIPDDLDMSYYHYRILSKGNPESLYKIHELKNKSNNI